MLFDERPDRTLFDRRPAGQSHTGPENVPPDDRKPSRAQAESPHYGGSQCPSYGSRSRL